MILEWSQGVSPRKKKTSPLKNSTKRSSPTNQAEIHKNQAVDLVFPYQFPPVFPNGSNGSPKENHLMGPLKTPWNRSHLARANSAKRINLRRFDPRGLRRIGKNHPTELGWWGEASLLVAACFHEKFKPQNWIVLAGRDENTKIIHIYKQMVFFFMMNSLTNEWKHIHPKTGSKKKGDQEFSPQPTKLTFFGVFQNKESFINR